MSWPRRDAQRRVQAQTRRLADETRRHEASLAALNAVADELRSWRTRQEADTPKKDSREALTLHSALVATAIALLTLIFATYSANTQHRDTLAAIDKAAEANRISQENAQNQLRAYLGFDPAAEGGMKVCSRFQPAPSADTLDLKPLFDQVINQCDGHRYRVRNVWPGESPMFSVFFDASSLASLQRSAKGDGVTVLVSSITYADEFNHPHRSTLCATLTGTIGAPRDVVDCGGAAPEDF